jgi:DNA-binding CsgD family transcriptional regulator
MERSPWTLLFTLLIALNASASSDTKNQQIAERLKQLVSLPPISQEQLDSLSDRLVYLNNLNSEMSDDVCHEIALLKTEVAHGCMNGGRTVHITGILDDPSSCAPHHGLYDFMLGNISYITRQYATSVIWYQRALQALGIQDPASVMIQLNLAAALHADERGTEAIDSLIIILNGEHWKTAPAVLDGKYNHQITINAAAMLSDDQRFEEALDWLQALNESNLSEYWKVIKVSNEYTANLSSAHFSACDSLWVKTLQHIPFADLPLPLFEYMISSWLATDAYDYLQQLIDEKTVANLLLTNEESLLSALLNPQITDSNRKQQWEILKATNQLERERMELLATAYEKRATKSDAFAGLETKLGLQQKMTSTWQWATLIMALSLLIYLLTRLYYKQQAENKIKAAVNHARVTKKSIDAASKLQVSRGDIRKIHMGLTKGHQIGEALLSLQKIEILYKDNSTGAANDGFQTLEGADALSEIELTILKMTLEGTPTKEIAHQLKVSSGYLYNSRSAIRKKLNIPKESSITLWVHRSQG